MANSGVHKFERNQARIGKYLMGVLGGAYCIPERSFRTSNGGNGKNFRGGFHLDEIYTNSNGAIRTKPRSNLSERAGLALLGAGSDGTVFVGHFSESSNDPVAIKLGPKKALMIENRIMKTIEGISPHTQHVYIYKSPEQCAAEKARRKGSEQSLLNTFDADTAILYSQYTNGGNLRGFITKYGKALRPDHIKSIVFQVLWTLHAIMTKYPSFRHCDLLLENVFIDNAHEATGIMEYKPDFVLPQNGLRVVIGDFANAHIDKAGYRNPDVMSGEFMDSFGIYEGMSGVYDAHLFLTQMFDFIGELPAAKLFGEFVRDCIPKAYMPTKTGRSAELTEQRLRRKSGADKDIPPVYGMLKHPYFSEYKVSALTGPEKARWPHGSMSVKLINPDRTKRVRRVAKRPLTEVNRSYKNIITSNENYLLSLKVKGPLVSKFNMNTERRKMLMNVLIKEKMKENNTLTPTTARAYVLREARGEFLPKPLARPMGWGKAIIPKAARSLNRMSPSKKKSKNAGSAPTVINITRTKRGKMPLNGRRFLVKGENNNKTNASLMLFKQLLALRQTRANMPTKMESAPIKMMPKAAAKLKKAAAGGTKQGLAPPSNLSLSKQKRWWKSQVEMDGSDLFVGGVKCDKQPVGVIRTVMDALGKKRPPKATKTDMCRLIKMHMENSNGNSNSNSNSNNEINMNKRRMPARPVARVRSPITFEEARNRLRARSVVVKAAKKQTKVKKTRLGFKPAKVFPMP
jgi:hypothetical protein